MENSGTKIAVVGAGAYGLLFSRIFVQKGYNVKIFEKNANVGGMWNFDVKNPKLGYDELNPDGSSESMYSSIVTNTSKYTFFASDALPDDDIIPHDCQWMNLHQVLMCFKMTAVKHNLLPLTSFNTEVTRIDKVGKSGWKVSFKKNNLDHIEDEIFDFVLCCSGGFRYAQMPELPNMDVFKGIAIHSAQIRLENVLFANRDVLIYGGSFSGIDLINYALKNKAKKVYWSLSRGNHKKNTWIIDHKGQKPNVTADLAISRYTFFEKPELAYEWNHKIFKPIHKEPNRPLTLPGDTIGITDFLFIIEQLNKNHLEKVAPIKCITHDGAELKDGRKLAVDVIVYCTGFVPRYPMIDHIMSREEQKKYEMYYHMLPIQRELQGVALIGSNDGIVANTATYECQARWLADFWATRTYDEEGQLFTLDELAIMELAIQQVKASKEAHINYRQVDLISLANVLAKDIGCLPPDYRKLIRSGNKPDVELGVALLHGPILSPLYYRISGNMVLDYAAEEFIKLTKRQFGEEGFNNMVEKAMQDPEKYFSDAGLHEEKVTAPYCSSIFEHLNK